MYFFCSDFSQVESATSLAKSKVRTNMSKHDAAQFECFKPQKFSMPSDVFFSSDEPKLQRMRVKYDFVSRNSRELTVRKGEIVEVSFSDMKQLFFQSIASADATSLLCARTAAGRVEAVVESEGQHRGGGLCAQQCPGG